MAQFTVLKPVVAMVFAGAVSACGLGYETPSGPYVRVNTNVVRYTPLGIASRPLGVNLGISLVLSGPGPTTGNTTFYPGANSSPSHGIYWMLDPRVPGLWRFTWNTLPCPGQALNVQVPQVYSTVDLICETSDGFWFGYSVDNSGQYVYTGGNDKIVDGWNGTLYENQCRTSADGRYDFCYQDDGNLVLYDGSYAIWDSGTWGSTPGRAVMQDDGNLVVYDAYDQAQWDSGTSGQAGNFVLVQSNRCALMYNQNGSYIPWGTSSCVAPGSSTTQQPPIPPTNLAASVSGSTVSLSWTAPPGPVADYVAQAGSSPGQSNIGTFYLNSQTYTTFYGVGPGTYYVRMMARNNGGSSPPSSEIAVVVP
jgi:hypothetical protein